MKPVSGKKIKISKDGPFLVSGSVPLQEDLIELDEQGNPIKWKKGESFPLKENYSLCRCGKTKTHPYCDGSHLKSQFDGTETAPHKPLMEMAEVYKGPDLDLIDAQCYCVGAGFCHPAGGTWKLAAKSNKEENRKLAIQQACDCPSGRLIARDKKTGKEIEPELEPSIGLVRVEREKARGPLWVKGGIPIESADGKEYEVRNRVTLCRCGKSSNKPFCDGSHI